LYTIKKIAPIGFALLALQTRQAVDKEDDADTVVAGAAPPLFLFLLGALIYGLQALSALVTKWRRK
jgi:hypothetical protein